MNNERHIVTARVVACRQDVLRRLDTMGHNRLIQFMGQAQVADKGICLYRDRISPQVVDSRLADGKHLGMTGTTL